ncbi:hypothetical protein ACFW3Y_33530 [Streptomyces rochei]|uniref:hypothetical protein n=1 Tax=Streptomyces TaxID=1883 RepID=UPI00368453C0
MTTSRLPSRLPRQIRPVAGEGLTSFIERLATANHIKTSYLRRYLVDPPWSWKGSPSWERLAAVVGRDPSSLKKILLSRRCVACGAVTFQPAGGSPRQTCSQACRQEAYRRRNPKPQKEERHAACQGCGEKLTFVPRGATRLWCSDSCRQDAERQRRREKAEANRAPAPPNLSCGVCDAPLEAGRRRWCSDRCCHIAYMRRRAAGDIPLRHQPTACTECSGPLEPGRNKQIRLTCSTLCHSRRSNRLKKERRSRE